jgi:hypothetical protein
LKGIRTKAKIKEGLVIDKMHQVGFNRNQTFFSVFLNLSVNHILKVLKLILHEKSHSDQKIEKKLFNLLNVAQTISKPQNMCIKDPFESLNCFETACQVKNVKKCSKCHHFFGLLHLFKKSP